MPMPEAPRTAQRGEGPVVPNVPRPQPSAADTLRELNRTFNQPSNPEDLIAQRRGRIEDRQARKEKERTLDNLSKMIKEGRELTQEQQVLLMKAMADSSDKVLTHAPIADVVAKRYGFKNFDALLRKHRAKNGQEVLIFDREGKQRLVELEAPKPQTAWEKMVDRMPPMVQDLLQDAGRGALTAAGAGIITIAMAPVALPAALGAIGAATMGSIFARAATRWFTKEKLFRSKNGQESQAAASLGQIVQHIYSLQEGSKLVTDRLNNPEAEVSQEERTALLKDMAWRIRDTELQNVRTFNRGIVNSEVLTALAGIAGSGIGGLAFSALNAKLEGAHFADLVGKHAAEQATSSGEASLRGHMIRLINGVWHFQEHLQPGSHDLANVARFGPVHVQSDHDLGNYARFTKGMMSLAGQHGEKLYHTFGQHGVNPLEIYREAYNHSGGWAGLFNQDMDAAYAQRLIEGAMSLTGGAYAYAQRRRNERQGQDMANLMYRSRAVHRGPQIPGGQPGSAGVGLDRQEPDGRPEPQPQSEPDVTTSEVTPSPRRFRMHQVEGGVERPMGYEYSLFDKGGKYRMPEMDESNPAVTAETVERSFSEWGGGARERHVIYLADASGLQDLERRLAELQSVPRTEVHIMVHRTRAYAELQQQMNRVLRPRVGSREPMRILVKGIPYNDGDLVGSDIEGLYTSNPDLFDGVRYQQFGDPQVETIRVMDRLDERRYNPSNRARAEQDFDTSAVDRLYARLDGPDAANLATLDRTILNWGDQPTAYLGDHITRTTPNGENASDRYLIYAPDGDLARIVEQAESVLATNPEARFRILTNTGGERYTDPTELAPLYRRLGSDRFDVHDQGNASNYHDYISDLMALGDWHLRGTTYVYLRPGEAGAESSEPTADDEETNGSSSETRLEGEGARVAEEARFRAELNDTFATNLSEAAEDDELSEGQRAELQRIIQQVRIAESEYQALADAAYFNITPTREQLDEVEEILEGALASLPSGNEYGGWPPAFAERVTALLGQMHNEERIHRIAGSSQAWAGEASPEPVATVSTPETPLPAIEGPVLSSETPQPSVVETEVKPENAEVHGLINELRGSLGNIVIEASISQNDADYKVAARALEIIENVERRLDMVEQSRARGDQNEEADQRLFEAGIGWLEEQLNELSTRLSNQDARTQFATDRQRLQQLVPTEPAQATPEVVVAPASEGQQEIVRQQMQGRSDLINEVYGRLFEQAMSQDTSFTPEQQQVITDAMSALNSTIGDIYALEDYMQQEHVPEAVLPSFIRTGDELRATGDQLDRLADTITDNDSARASIRRIAEQLQATQELRATAPIFLENPSSPGQA